MAAFINVSIHASRSDSRFVLITASHNINRIPLCVRYWATAIRSADKEGKSRRRSRIRFLWRPPVPLLRRETLSWVDVDDVACVGAQLPRTDPTIAIWRLNLVQRAHTHTRGAWCWLTMRSRGLRRNAIHCFGSVAVSAGSKWGTWWCMPRTHRVQI